MYTVNVSSTKTIYLFVSLRFTIEWYEAVHITRGQFLGGLRFSLLLCGQSSLQTEKKYRSWTFANPSSPSPRGIWIAHTCDYCNGEPKLEYIFKYRG